MSVATQIKQDWSRAIKAANKRQGDPDRTAKVRLAIDGRGCEYFVSSEDKGKKTIRVFRDGINCSVYKRFFNLRWVDKSYSLKPLPRPC